MKTMKKRVMGLLLLAVLMVTTLGSVASAAELKELDDHYRVRIAMEVSAGMRSVVRTNGLIIGDTEINDWSSAVAAGSDVSASLEQRTSETLTAPTALSYEWQFYNSAGTCVKTSHDRETTVPTTCEGGVVVVTIKVSRSHNGWAASQVTGAANIG